MNVFFGFKFYLPHGKDCSENSPFLVQRKVIPESCSYHYRSIQRVLLNSHELFMLKFR